MNGSKFWQFYEVDMTQDTPCIIRDYVVYNESRLDAFLDTYSFGYRVTVKKHEDLLHPCAGVVLAFKEG